MSANQDFKSLAIFREIQTDSDKTLKNFFGDSSSHKKFSEERAITMVPTLEFVNSLGEQLDNPLIGALVMDFYGAYIERGITNSLNELKTN